MEINYPEPSMMGGKAFNERYGIFCGVQMQKSWAELFQIEVLLNRGKFQRIVELGTGTGATTLMLAVQGLQRGMGIYSYDIGSPHELQQMSSQTAGLLSHMDVIYEVVDVFSIQDKISNLIGMEGRTLVYNDCGGGKDDGKRKASLTFAKHMKKDDVMLVHDYNTSEFHGEDAKQLMQECGMKPYMQEWLDQYDAKHGAFIKL